MQVRTEGSSRNNRNAFGSWKQCVVPVTMVVCAPDIHGGHLRFADPDTGRAVVRVPVAIDLQPRSSPGGADQADDGREVVQGFAAPVRVDERRQPVLYTVPFAGPWRQVAHADLHAEFACELLQFDLPQPGPVPVGVTAADGDMQLQVAGVARRHQCRMPSTISIPRVNPISIPRGIPRWENDSPVSQRAFNVLIGICHVAAPCKEIAMGTPDRGPCMLRARISREMPRHSWAVPQAVRGHFFAIPRSARTTLIKRFSNPRNIARS